MWEFPSNLVQYLMLGHWRIDVKLCTCGCPKPKCNQRGLCDRFHPSGTKRILLSTNTQLISIYLSIISTWVSKLVLKLPFDSINGHHYQPMSPWQSSCVTDMQIYACDTCTKHFKKDEDICLDRIGLCAQHITIEWYQRHPANTFVYVIFTQVVELHQTCNSIQ